MPLVTEIIRNGNVVTEGVVWDYPMLSIFLTTALKEDCPEEEYNKDKTYGDLPEGAWVDFSMSSIYYLDTKCNLWKGSHTVKDTHTYFQDTDREFTFLPGDVLKMWRESSSG